MKAGFFSLSKGLFPRGENFEFYFAQGKIQGFQIIQFLSKYYARSDHSKNPTRESSHFIKIPFLIGRFYSFLKKWRKEMGKKNGIEYGERPPYFRGRNRSAKGCAISPASAKLLWLHPIRGT
jgi:hypothetical protein